MLFEHSEAVGKTKLHLQILIEKCRCVLVYGGKAKRIHVVSPALYFGSKLVWFSSNNRSFLIIIKSELKLLSCIFFI